MKLNASGNSGIIRCISDFQQPCVSKTEGLGAKHTPKPLYYPVYVVIVCHLVKQSETPLGFLFIAYVYSFLPNPTCADHFCNQIQVIGVVKSV